MKNIVLVSLFFVFFASGLLLAEDEWLSVEEQWSNWYVAGTGSFVFRDNITLYRKTELKFYPTRAAVRFKNNFGASIAVGYIANLWRIELEALFRRTQLRKVSLEFDGPKPESYHATFYTWSVAGILNFYRDFPITALLCVYLGVGAGISWNPYKFDMGAIIWGMSTEPIKFNNHAFGPALQAMAGVTYKLRKNVHVSAGYRFYVPPQLSQTEVKDYEAGWSFLHSIDIGIRFLLP